MRHMIMLMIGTMVGIIPCQNARADVVFVVDSSRSICGSDSTCSNWRSLLNFVNSVVNRFNVGQDNTRIGFIRYSSTSAISNEFYLNSNGFDRSRVTSAVSGVQYQTGGSLYGDLVTALQRARTQQFVTNRGDRVGAPNVIIVLTNGGVQANTAAVSPRLRLVTSNRWQNYTLIRSETTPSPLCTGCNLVCRKLWGVTVSQIKPSNCFRRLEK